MRRRCWHRSMRRAGAKSMRPGPRRRMPKRKQRLWHTWTCTFIPSIPCVDTAHRTLQRGNLQEGLEYTPSGIRSSQNVVCCCQNSQFADLSNRAGLQRGQWERKSEKIEQTVQNKAYCWAPAHGWATRVQILPNKPQSDLPLACGGTANTDDDRDELVLHDDFYARPHTPNARSLALNTVPSAMRESNFAFPAQNRACVCITSQLYDRRGECTLQRLLS